MLYYSHIERLPSLLSPPSLHDALPILRRAERGYAIAVQPRVLRDRGRESLLQIDQRLAAPVAANGIGESLSIDRKSTRLNSSHLVISYAVFCLKKKTTIRTTYVVD